MIFSQNSKEISKIPAEYKPGPMIYAVHYGFPSKQTRAFRKMNILVQEMKIQQQFTLFSIG